MAKSRKMGKQLPGVLMIRPSINGEPEWFVAHLSQKTFAPAKRKRWYPPTEDRSFGWQTTWPK